MDEDDEIRQPDTWEIIRKYFDENGLVQQQRASYNEFILQNIQEIIEDYKGQIEIVATQQYLPGQKHARRKIQVEFGKVRIAQPKVQENDGRSERMLPYMARLRKLTYSCQLYVDILTRTYNVGNDGGEQLDKEDAFEKQPLGKIPVMLRSEVCRLNMKNNKDMMDMKECPQDQGGYFVINGSEKVLLAQERRANNLVFCFKKTLGKFAYIAEVGSQVEKGNKPPSTLFMKLWNRETNRCAVARYPAQRGGLPPARGDPFLRVLAAAPSAWLRFSCPRCASWRSAPWCPGTPQGASILFSPSRSALCCSRTLRSDPQLGAHAANLVRLLW